MGVATFERSDLDLFSLEVMADPYPHFAQLRERASVVWLEKLSAFAITRYEPIREVLGDWEHFSSKRVAFNDTWNDVLKGTSLTADPPEHTALRAALTENLSPRALRGMNERIDQQADEIVAGLVERGSFDAINDLARAVPLAVVVDLIGVQGETREKLLVWGERAFDCLGPMNERAGAALPIAGELYQWSVDLTADQLAEGSMGHSIFLAGQRGDIPMENCGKIIHQYVAAGMETTIGAIGNAVRQLAAHPDQFDLLRADPSLVPSAFNEVLRFESLMIAQARHANEDVELDGTVIPGGSQVALLFGSGNRDPRHYDDPDAFLVQRNPVDHLSLGYGVHTCAGQGLARLEVHATLASLAKRIKRFTVGEGVRRITNMTLALDKLPVVEIEPA